MIVPMKKLSVLLLNKQKEEFLSSLRELGVVHVVEKDGELSSEAQAVSDKIRRVARVSRILPKVAAELKIAQAPCADAWKAVEEYEQMEASREAVISDAATINKDISTLEPWGDFSVETVEKLAAAGIRVRFFDAAEKKFDSFAGKLPAFEIIAREGGHVRFVVVERGEAKTRIDADEVILPRISLAAAKKQAFEKQQQAENIAKRMKAAASCSAAVSELETQLAGKRTFEKARQSLVETVGGHVVLLTGWVPAKKQDETKKMLDSCTCWYSMAPASLGDDVPVTLKNDRFSKMFETITGIYSLPNYFEIDPTPFFAPFFMLFVGLCLGDLGYGIIVTALGAVLAAKAKPAMRGLFVMVTMLGISTAVAGIMLNSFFGCTIFGGPGIAEGTSLLPSGANVFSPLGQVNGPNGPVFPMMAFALVIGVIQVLLGMALKAYNQFREGGWQAGFMPISTMLILMGLIVWGAKVNFLDLGMSALVIGPVKIGALLTSLPKVSGPGMLFSGIVLLLFFNNPSLKVFWRPLMGLWEIYQLAGGLISNLLSYLRLFALGLSGGLLGAAFNQIAFMFIMKDGKPEWATPMAIFTVLLLIVGHSINIGLSAIGSFVHPLRLTFVEFYSNVGFKGGSKVYMPLKKV